MTIMNGRPLKRERRMWASLSSFLARPHPSIVDREMKRRSQVLAWLTLALSVTVLVVVGLLGLLFPSWLLDPDTLLFLAGAVLLLISYLMNRAGHYQGAAIFFIIITSFISTTAPFLPRGVPQSLIVTLAPILLTAFVYSPRASIAVALVSVGVSAVMVALVPYIDRTPYFITLLFVVVIAVILLVFMHHQQAFDRERRRELADANADLRRSELRLEQRVLERTRELDKARVEAEQASRLKTQFLANVSHELRTPLNAIINFNQFVSSGLHGKVNQQQRDSLTKSTNSARHLLALINDVLDMSKIEAGHVDLLIEDGVDLVPDLREVATTTRALLEDKPVTLELDISEDLPRVDADRRRLRQVLLNLTSNAVKFTEAGTIKLSAWSGRERMTIAVSDTGSGIAAGKQSLIFEPFSQLQRARGSKPAGTGLGLAISKSLVEAHGGTLWIESEVGQGSTFFVSIPVQEKNGTNVGEGQ